MLTYSLLSVKYIYTLVQRLLSKIYLNTYFLDRRWESKQKIILQFFNFESMKKMNQLLPRVPIGVLTSNRAHTTMDALQEFSTYADWFNLSYGIVTNELVNQVHSLGMQIGPRTVRSQEVADFLFEMKVDAKRGSYELHPNC